MPCGTTENQFFGTFAPLDADDDGLYDNNLNCAWEIHSFNPARITSFYLTEFDIPASNGCSLDYLKIYDEERSYGIFCGTNRPPLITTTEIVLHIEFQSDCCINGKGFLAVFVQHDWECGGIFIQPTGELQPIDRDNDGLYDANQYCVWALVAPEDEIIEITFLSIKVQYDEGCIFDMIQVNDQALCGAFENKTFRSNENLLQIYFYTDSEYEFTKWTAEYRHLRNGTRLTSTNEPTLPATLNTGNGHHGISHTASITSTFSTTTQETEKITTTPTNKPTPVKPTSGNPHQVSTGSLTNHYQPGYRTDSTVTDIQLATNISPYENNGTPSPQDTISTTPEVMDVNTARSLSTDVNSATTDLSHVYMSTAAPSKDLSVTTAESLSSLPTEFSTEQSSAQVNTLALSCQVLVCIFSDWVIFVSM